MRVRLRSDRVHHLSAGRYFAIVNERGNICLTWGKNADPKKMMDAEQRYEVNGIRIQCVDGDADDDPTNGTQMAFNLVLPENRPITKASRVRSSCPPSAAKSLRRIVF